MPPDTPLAPTTPTSPITVQSPTDTTSTPNSVAAGPVRKWELPPKPKPGRKPAANDPENKRKAQNRAAQRAFRERRAGKVQDLQERIDLDKKYWEAERGQLRRDIDNQRSHYEQQIAYLNTELKQWEQTARREESIRKEKENEISQLQKQLADLNLSRWNTDSSRSAWDVTSPAQNAERPLASGKHPSEQVQGEHANHFELCDNCGHGGRCPCIDQMIASIPDGTAAPPTEPQTSPYDEMEIDFTTKRPSRAVDNQITDATETLGSPTTSNYHCGFCTDENNCVCRSAALKDKSRAEPFSIPQLVSPPESNSGDDPRLMRRPPVIEPLARANGPGSCPSCLADPKRASFCRSLARLMPPPNSKAADMPTPSTPGGEDTQGRMTCEDAYTTLSKDPNFVQNRDSVAFLSKLRTEPPSEHTPCNTCNTTGCSPYDVDAASVLTAMATGQNGK